MRMSGFIIGGILGAAAATYWSRNKTPKMLTDVNWNQVVDKAGDMAKSAKNMWDSAAMFIPSKDGEENIQQH
jgi:hypothetical protein